MPSRRLQSTKSGAKSPIPIPPDVAARLHLAHYDRSILDDMSKEEIHKLFGYATTENLRLERFFVNAIWQFYEQIKAGNPPDFFHKRGFIRGMWYPIKTPMSQHNFKQFREDHSSAMGDALALLVEAGLCTYVDFQFRDDNKSNREVGEGNPHVILMTEKGGFFGMLNVASQKYGCTVVATGGVGSLLTCNYMLNEIAARGVDITKQEFAVLTIVDFDPTGYNISEEFVHDMECLGVRRFRRFEQFGRKDYKWLDLIVPSRVELRPGENIYDHTYTVHSRFTKKPKGGGDPWAKKWARTTGGVDGKGGRGKKWKLGIQADEFREAYLVDMLERFIPPLLSLPAGAVQRRLQMKEFEEVLGKYLIHRMSS